MLRPIQPILYYYLNQDYIAEFLCINKDKPKMHCNGKCYLMRSVKKQQEQNLPARPIQLELYPIGFVYILNLFSQKEYISFQKKDFAYQNLYTFLKTPSVFHPPRA